MRAKNLCNAGEARPDLVANPAEVRNFLFVCRDELRRLRSGSDKTHITSKDIKQLGQLVERRPPQDPAHPHHLLVVRMHGDALCYLAIVLSVDRAEFVGCELPSTLAHSLLYE